jgi:hypothetical protein
MQFTMLFNYIVKGNKIQIAPLAFRKMLSLAAVSQEKASGGQNALRHTFELPD